MLYKAYERYSLHSRARACTRTQKEKETNGRTITRKETNREYSNTRTYPNGLLNILHTLLLYKHFCYLFVIPILSRLRRNLVETLSKPKHRLAK